MLLNVISLFGGLALFLYGMHLMSDSIQEGSTVRLRQILEKVTDNPIKAFLLGVVVTALIQSSKAAIVITAGLVGAGVLSFKQSVGIVIGANVGTTITGQIIGLLDMEEVGGLGELIQPSNLAPVALIFGICLIMFFRFRNSDMAGKILIGFGILFTGLLNMTAAVDLLVAAGDFDDLVNVMMSNPLAGYVSGAVVAFILQSSSASVGVLQAFAASDMITFKGVFVVILGIYLGECLTTYMVAAENRKTDAKRVGMTHVVYTLIKSAISLFGVLLFRLFGILKGIWNLPVDSGTIANINTVFNLASAVLIFPMLGLLEKAVMAVLKDEGPQTDRLSEKLEALSPTFFSTPSLALNSVFGVLVEMLELSRSNISRAFSMVGRYDQDTAAEIEADEENIDRLTDRLSEYMVQLSSNLSSAEHSRILSEYYKLVNQFENLADQGMKITRVLSGMSEAGREFSGSAVTELGAIQKLTEDIFGHAYKAFAEDDRSEVFKMEPLNEVGHELINRVKDLHIERITGNECTLENGIDLIDILDAVEYILSACDNIGMSILVGTEQRPGDKAHEYRMQMRSPNSKEYSRGYKTAREAYFGLLEQHEEAAEAAEE